MLEPTRGMPRWVTQSEKNEGAGRRRVAPGWSTRTVLSAEGRLVKFAGDEGTVAGQASNQVIQQLSDKV